MVDTQHATRNTQQLARPSLHPLAWSAWVIAVLVALTTTRNPFYLGEILLLVGLVAWAWQPAPVEETSGKSISACGALV